MTEAWPAGFAALVAAIWVIKPLFGSRRAIFEGDRRLADLADAKRAVLRRLLDLDLDHKTGKIADDDYLAERSAAEMEAIATLGELDDAGAEDPLELEIAAARKRLKG